MGFNLGNFLFGSDPGEKPRKALQEFGLTGGGEIGDSLTEQANALAALLGARQRTASGQSLARAGLTGSGIAEDVLGNAALTEADFLQNARRQLLQQRLQALGIAAGAPRKKGVFGSLVRGGLTAAGLVFGGPAGAAAGNQVGQAL